MDGTLVNPVPVALARALGADLVICVNLNGDPGGPVVREVPVRAPRRGFLQVLRGRLSGLEPPEPEIPVPGIARVMLDAFKHHAGPDFPVAAGTRPAGRGHRPGSRGLRVI